MGAVVRVNRTGSTPVDTWLVYTTYGVHLCIEHTGQWTRPKKENLPFVDFLVKALHVACSIS